MAAEPDTVAGVLRRQADAGARIRCWSATATGSATPRPSAVRLELARGLVALGAGKGTHVGLLYPNGADFVVGMLAAARIGAVVVPFTTFATAPRTSGPAGPQRRGDPAGRIVPTAATTSASAAGRRSGDSRSAAAPRADRRLCQNPNTSTRHCSRRWKPTSTDRIRWRSSTRRVRPRRPKGVVHTHAALLAHQQQPQRDPRTDGRRQAVLQLALLLDRRIRLRPAGHVGRRIDAGVLQRHRRGPRRSICSRPSGPP